MSKLIMLDSAGVIVEVYNKLQEMKKVDTNLPFLELHQRNVINIATQCVVNLIEARSVFPVDGDKGSNSNGTEYTLGQLFDLNIRGMTKAMSKAMTEVADNVERDLLDNLMWQIFPHVKINNHNIWTVVPIGRNIAIVEGEDYRVIKYYELTNAERLSEDLHVDLNPIIDYLSNKLNQYLSRDTFYSSDNVRGLLEPIVSELLVTKFFIDSLIRKYTNMELVTYGSPIYLNPSLVTATENFDVDVYAMLSNLVEKILNTYDEYVFREILDSDTHYDISLMSGRLSLTPVDAIQRSKHDEDFYLRQLVTALLNGDYLPEEERKAAESYYSTNSHLFI